MGFGGWGDICAGVWDLISSASSLTNFLRFCFRVASLAKMLCANRS